MWCPCPEPGDKEGWRQWNKVFSIAAVIAAVVLIAIIIFARL